MRCYEGKWLICNRAKNAAGECVMVEGDEATGCSSKGRVEVGHETAVVDGELSVRGRE